VRGVEATSKEKLNALALFMYRAVQIGVLLLTAGTILGGVWADYSWGRFWGWDPKETWALIADLGYLAVLHGRFSGWLRTFGTVASIVCAFSGVVMAWYGVNFVLGVGLHSYGFGGGGVQYVAAILVIQLAYVGFAAFKHHELKSPT
jgi:ABC-type transport system involved in cytochrome c biogenesis permease subunit